MYAQFNISPGPAKASDIHQKRELDEDIAQLILAPFTPKPKIFFEDVLIGQETTKKLSIKNPTHKSIELFIIQLPTPELNVTLSWLQNTVPAQSEISLEITWCPNLPGSWREVLILEDGKRVKREIPIIFKSTCPKTKKPIKRAKTKSPTLLSKKLRLSPVRQTKFKPRKIRVSPKTTNRRVVLPKNAPQIVIHSVRNEHEQKYEQHIFNFNKSDVFLSPSNTDFNNIPVTGDNIRRETYVIEERLEETENIPPEDENISKDSLEMSPDQERILNKLNLSPFTFSPVPPCEKFMPNGCSSEIKKSRRNSATFRSSVMKELFINTNIIHEVSQMASPSPRFLNVSSETYVKGNVSSETYIKGNVSSETYTKGNVSTETYVKGSISPGIFTKKEPTRILSNDVEYVSKQMRLHLVDNETAFTLSNEVDPFMSSTIYFFDSSRYENYFAKWLNALLTPPLELDVQEHNQPMDVAKLWQDCKHKDVAVAATKEAVSNMYHTNARLNSLRRVAKNFFRSAKFSEAVIKAMVAVDESKIVIRTDKNVHINLSLQSEVISLFMCYNPLWLRIALETIYDTVIPMASNSDVVGLTKFIMHHFFKDPSLLRKYKSVVSNTYGSEIKKFIFKKFLLLVYFLDQSKLNKIISHDPCLFVKSASIKESREILLKFSKELVSAGVGDITKFLRYKGYTVSYKQTYIDEFDYAVKCLGNDLRDGVRLAKVMEIILVQEGLTKKMRVPAISRLQKIHNMTVVFNALYNAGFQIEHGIEPKDIVDGHREKTLSFLWQIVNKFQLPRIEKASLTIQKWWRSTTIIIKRRILNKQKQHQENAARKIQKWYQNIKTAHKVERFVGLLKKYLVWSKQNRAATKIQSFLKMVQVRRRYQRKRNAIILIQSHTRRMLAKKHLQKRKWAAIKIQSFLQCLACRRRYLKLKMVVLTIEQIYIANKLALDAKNNYLQIRTAAIYIQRKFRANKIMKKHHNSYNELRAAVIKIQKWYRSQKVTKAERENFLKIKNATIVIETWYKAIKIRDVQKQNYQTLRNAIILIQQRFRAKLLMKTIRHKYLVQRKACLTLQRYFKSHLLMKKEMTHYKQLKMCTIFIQRKYRAKILMKKEKSYYNKLKLSTILIQRKFRATLLMKKQKDYYNKLKLCAISTQRRFRAKILMKQHKAYYEKLKSCTVFIQRKFKSKIMMRKEKAHYDKLKLCTVFIQRKFRGNILMKNEKAYYSHLKSCTVFIQRKFRANILMKKDKDYYGRLKLSTIFIQRQFRANILMKKQKVHYEKLKSCSVFTQRKFRAKLLMRRERDYYNKLKSCVVFIQRKFRAKILIKEQRELYRKLKLYTIFIQRKYRAHILMKQEKAYYRKLNLYTIFTQRKFKAKLLMRKEKDYYDKLKSRAVFIQRKFRAQILMKKERIYYEKLKKCAIFIQRKFRAHISMKKQKAYYEKLKFWTVFTQRKFRAKILMRKQIAYYNKLKCCTTFIQRKFRAKILMKNERAHYQQLKLSTLFIQRRLRAVIMMKQQQKYYNKLKTSTVLIQRKFRANILMKHQKAYYEKLKTCTVFIQRKFRAQILMKKERHRYRMLKSFTILIQRKFIAKQLMRKHSNYYHKLKLCVVFIQRKFRANILMKKEKAYYNKLKSCVVSVQRKFRAKILMRNEYSHYQKLKKATVMLQDRYKANKSMKTQRNRYKIMRKAACLIQQWYRSIKLMVAQRKNFAEIRQTVLMVQARFRANQEMKKQRNYYQALKKAVIQIQLKYRALNEMKQQRLYYLNLKKATITVQRRFKANQLMKKERTKFFASKHAVMKIWCYYKGYKLMLVEKERYEKLKQSVIFVQRKFRANKAMEIESAKYKKKLEAIKTIQRYIRGYLVRKHFNGEIGKLKQIKEQRIAAIKIQAVWRGYNIRKSNPKYVEMRKRVLSANSEAILENTLGFRRDNAIKIIINENSSLKMMIYALENLDFIIRRCRDTCIQLSKMLPEQLYIMILQSNKSPGEINTATLATSILISFCKFSKTSAQTWIPKHMDDLITTLLRFCDVEYNLFPYLCTLVWLFAHNDEYKEFIKTIPNLQMRLNKAKVKCERKQKMWNACRYKKIPSVFVTFGIQALPALAPDWGVEYEHRPRTFRNSVHAINNVLTILQ